MKTFLLSILSLFVIADIIGQTTIIIDDFESGTGNWSSAFFPGNFETSTTNSVTGSSSGYLWNPNNSGVGTTYVQHTSFIGAFANYEVWFRVDEFPSGGTSADANFTFQTQGNGDNYNLGVFPSGGDFDGPGPGTREVVLYKTIGGTTERIDESAATISLDQWYKFNIIRKCTGQIEVYLDDVLLFSAVDFSIMDNGGVSLASWFRNIYVDDASYTYTEDEVLDTLLVETICEGESIDIAGLFTYSTTGVYSDTIFPLRGNRQCIINTDLTVVPPLVDTVYTEFCISSAFFSYLGPAPSYLSIPVTQSGTYLETVPSSVGCDSTTVHIVTVYEDEYAETDTTICVDDPNYTFTELSNGYKDVSTPINGGCVSILRYNLNIIGDEQFDFPEEYFFCDNVVTSDLSSVFNNIIWSDNGSTSLQRDFNTAGIYYFTSILTGGCLYTDSLKVTESCEPRVYIPNVFAPGSGGDDDVFKVYSEYLEEIEVVIADRWGNILHSSTEPNAIWDGNFRGEPVNTGSYVVSVRYKGPLQTYYRSQFESLLLLR